MQKTQRLSGAYTSAPARIYKCLVWFDSDTHSGSWIYQNPLNKNKEIEMKKFGKVKFFIFKGSVLPVTDCREKRVEFVPL